MARVIIPSNAEKLLALAKQVYQKHTADGDASPLKVLSDFNWEDNGPRIDEAEALNERAKSLLKEAERVFEQRDALLRPITGTVRSSSRTLKGIHRASPKRLGDWGFTVDDTPRSKKP